MSRNAAVDFAKDQVRVNVIYPGHIRTPFIEDAIADEAVLKNELAGIPLNFIADPEDIAYGAIYLASDESRFVTGTKLLIDGGLTAIKFSVIEKCL